MKWPKVGVVIVAVASASLAVFLFVFDHKDGLDKNGDRAAIVSGQGIASGADKNAP